MRKSLNYHLFTKIFIMKKTFFLLALILPVCSLLAQTIPTPVMPDADDQNYLMITSDGSNNVANVDQQGKDNWSTVFQDGNSNKAVVKQINHNTTNALNPDNYDNVVSTVTQLGNGNRAKVTQEHDGTLGPLGVMTANILQDGNNNRATQKQGPGNKTGVMMADIFQDGNGNKANQEQGGYLNNEFITQVGNSNVAKQFQGNGLMGSNALILQTFS